MRHDTSSKLPSVISTKPFYIPPGYKLSPFRYRDSNTQSWISRVSQNRASVYQKSTFRVDELRSYIQNTIGKIRVNRIDQLLKKKQQDQGELQKRRKRVKQQKQRHMQMMRRMIQYLFAMKKYYWVRLPCDCGCEKHNMRSLEGINIQAETNKPNNILYRFNKFKIPLQDQNLITDDSNRHFQKISNSSISSILNKQLRQLGIKYFLLLNNLQKQAKNHLSSTKGVHRIIQQMIKSKNQEANGIINVLSLTKGHWEHLFKDLVDLKKLQKKLIKMSKQNNCQVQYSQVQRNQKLLLDEMYEELHQNKQYFYHIETVLKQQKPELFEEIRESDQQTSETDKMDTILQMIQQQSKLNQHLTEKSSLRQSKKQSKILDMISQYFDENRNYLAQGHKAEIHNTFQFQNIISDFLKNQNMINSRKKINKKTLLQSLGIQHLVQRRTSKVDPESSSSSFFDSKRISKERRGTSFLNIGKTNSFYKQIGRKTNPQPKKSNTNKISKIKKKKKVEPQLIEEDFPDEVQTPPQSQKVIQPQKFQFHIKNNFKYHPVNFLNQAFVSPVQILQQQSTLKNYQKQNIYKKQNQYLLSKFKSQKIKKKLQYSSKTHNHEFLYSKIDKHQNAGIIKTRLYQLFKMDQLNSFKQQTIQFLNAEDRMEQNLEKQKNVRRFVHEQDNYDWVEKLDFKILEIEIDVMDLVLSQKVKITPIDRKDLMLQEDCIEFVKESTKTGYQQQCEKNRIKAFITENSYMKRKCDEEKLSETLQQYL